jgi:uncharacterized membrane protein YheB (UPF0754 family)
MIAKPRAQGFGGHSWHNFAAFFVPKPCCTLRPLPHSAPVGRWRWCPCLLTLSSARSPYRTREPILHMVDFLSKYISRHFKFDDVLSLGGEVVPAETTINRSPGAIAQASKIVRRRVLMLLKVLPYICVGGFVVTFFHDISFKWDLPFPIFGRDHVDVNYLFRTLTVSGLIGYGTNWLAIKMLFKPRHRRPIWGQGLIPANKDNIARNMARAINANLLNEEQIKDKIHRAQIAPKLNKAFIKGASGLLNDKEFQDEVKAVILEFLTGYLNNPATKARVLREIEGMVKEESEKRFGGKLIVRFLGINFESSVNKMMTSLPNLVKDMLDMDEFMNRLDKNLMDNSEAMEGYLAHLIFELVDRINIYEVLRSQLASFDETQLEELILNATNEHLDYIQYLGAFLGILGGLVLLEPVVMTTILVFFIGSLFALDTFLHNLRRRPE